MSSSVNIDCISIPSSPREMVPLVIRGFGKSPGRVEISIGVMDSLPKFLAYGDIS